MMSDAISLVMLHFSNPRKRFVRNCNSFTPSIKLTASSSLSSLSVNQISRWMRFWSLGSVYWKYCKEVFSSLFLKRFRSRKVKFYKFQSAQIIPVAPSLPMLVSPRSNLSQVRLLSFTRCSPIHIAPKSFISFPHNLKSSFQSLGNLVKISVIFVAPSLPTSFYFIESESTSSFWRVNIYSAIISTPSLSILLSQMLKSSTYSSVRFDSSISIRPSNSLSISLDSRTIFKELMLRLFNNR